MCIRDRAYTRSKDSDNAVITGLAKSGRVITSAALIMVAPLRRAEPKGASELRPPMPLTRSVPLRWRLTLLAATVVAELALDPLSAHWFVFCNRGRDKLKILYWDHNGFWLYYRRLERGRFSWPAQAPSAALSITARQLAWLLDGLALDQSRAHRAVDARIAI